MSKTRLNANIDATIYEEFKSFAQKSGMSMTAYLEQLLKDELKRRRYEMMRNEFDELAREQATRDMLAVDAECSADGL